MEANIKKVVYHTTPCFTSFYLTFVNSESFFKTSGRPNILILTTFAGYRISTFALQNSLKFIFPLGSKASKLSRNYQKILADFKISISFYYAAFVLFDSPRKKWCWKISLKFLSRKNDVKKTSVKFLFLLYVTLMVFCGKI